MKFAFPLWSAGASSRTGLCATSVIITERESSKVLETINLQQETSLGGQPRQQPNGREAPCTWTNAPAVKPQEWLPAAEEEAYSFKREEEMLAECLGLLTLEGVQHPAPDGQARPRGILKEHSCHSQGTAAKRVAFNNRVTVAETYSPGDYSRKGDFVARTLTPEMAAAIKQELNRFKTEMQVGEGARGYTQFYDAP